MPSRSNLRYTANGRLMDDSIRRMVMVQRYGAGQARSILAFLNDQVFPDLIGRLQSRLDRIRLRGSDSGVFTTSRYREMIGSMDAILQDGMQQGAVQVKSSLRDFAKSQATWQAQQIKQEGAAVGLDIGKPNLAVLPVIVSQPIHGQPLAGWFQGLADTTQQRLTQQIGIGLAQGETSDQIIRRVRGTRAQDFRDGVLQTTRAQAAAVVQTAVNHVSTQATLATIQENADVLDGMVWIATLDISTCPTCGPLDGTVLPLDSKKAPPLHVNCRCTLAPALKSWDKLGLKAKNVPEMTRASMDGQVPKSLRWAAWVGQQDAERQNEILGPARARLYRAGKVELGSFTDDSGRWIPLDRLDS